MLFLWSIHRCFLSIPGFDLVLLPFRRSLGPPAVPEHPLTRWPFRWRRVQTLEVTRTPRSEPTRFARTQRNAAIGRVEGPNSSSMLSVSSASAAAAGQTQRLRALVRCTHTHTSCSSCSTCGSWNCSKVPSHGIQPQEACLIRFKQV